MEPVIESLVSRIDQLEQDTTDLKLLETDMNDIKLAITNAAAMFPIILDKLKQTEETYDVILKFIKLQGKKED